MCNDGERSGDEGVNAENFFYLKKRRRRKRTARVIMTCK